MLSKGWERPMKNTIANRYAQGLFNLAKENKIVDEILNDCESILKIYEVNKNLQVFLENPKVLKEQKQQVFKTSIKESVNQFTYDFIMLLIDKGRISQLRNSLNQFIILSNIDKGLMDVQVTSASELAIEQKESLKTQLEKASGKTIKIENIIDPQIIGGLIIKIGNNVIDGSLKYQINKIRESLLKAQVMEIEVRE